MIFFRIDYWIPNSSVFTNKGKKIVTDLQLLLVLICFQPSYLNALPFSKTYSNINSSANIPLTNLKQFCTTSDNGILYTSADYLQNVNVTKLDSSGCVSWAKGFRFLKNTEGTIIKQMPDGSIYVAGYNYTGSNYYERLSESTWFVLKLNSIGNLIWSKEINVGLNGVPFDIIELSGSYIQIIGGMFDLSYLAPDNSERGLIINCLKSNGLVLDVISVNKTPRDIADTFASCHFNKVLNISGQQYYGGYVNDLLRLPRNNLVDYNLRPLLAKRNGTGGMEFYIYDGYSVNDMLYLNDGSLLLLVQCVYDQGYIASHLTGIWYFKLIKVNPNDGSIIWSKIYNSSYNGPNYNNPSSIVQTQSGDFLIGGYMEPGSKIGSSVFKVDNSGNLIGRAKVLDRPSTGFMGFQSITKAPNNEFAGLVLNSVTNYQNIVRFSEDLNSLCDFDSIPYYQYNDNVTQLEIGSGIITNTPNGIDVMPVVYNPAITISNICAGSMGQATCCINYNDTVNATLCQGETYNFAGQSYNSTGTYSHAYITKNGCDSIVVLNLRVNPSYNVNVKDTICNGSSITINNSVITEAGAYADAQHTTAGCDSTIIHYVAVKQCCIPSLSKTQTCSQICYHIDCMPCIKVMEVYINGVPKKVIINGNDFCIPFKLIKDCNKHDLTIIITDCNGVKTTFNESIQLSQECCCSTPKMELMPDIYPCERICYQISCIGCIKASEVYIDGVLRKITVEDNKLCIPFSLIKDCEKHKLSVEITDCNGVKVLFDDIFHFSDDCCCTKPSLNIIKEDCEKVCYRISCVSCIDKAKFYIDGVAVNITLNGTDFCIPFDLLKDCDKHALQVVIRDCKGVKTTLNDKLQFSAECCCQPALKLEKMNCEHLCYFIECPMCIQKADIYIDGVLTTIPLNDNAFCIPFDFVNDCNLHKLRVRVDACNNEKTNFEENIQFAAECCTEPCKIRADFGYDTTTHQLSDLSAIGVGTTITAWSWNFGDGSTSALQHPLHVYNSSGTYKTCLYLFARNEDGSTCCNLICKDVTVNVPVCTINQVINIVKTKPTKGKTQLSFTSTTTSSQPSTLVYKWNFGDGSTTTDTLTSTANTSSYIYNNCGSCNANVCLTITAITAGGITCSVDTCIVTYIGLYVDTLISSPNWPPILLVNVFGDKKAINITWNHFTGDKTIQVMNMSGKIVLLKNIGSTETGKNEINISNFAPGKYKYKVISTSGVNISDIFEIR
jgi:hypothetical protein